MPKVFRPCGNADIQKNERLCQELKMQLKGLTYAFRDRRKKKSEFRALWIQRINAAVRLEGLSYSKFMGLVHKADVDINRKVLADLAMNHPEAFKAIVAKVKELAK